MKIDEQLWDALGGGALPSVPKPKKEKQPENCVYGLKERKTGKLLRKKYATLGYAKMGAAGKGDTVSIVRLAFTEDAEWISDKVGGWMQIPF